MWIAAALLFWAVTPWLTTVEGFLVSPMHFVERHGLVIIIALGESIVVVGAGAAGVPINLRLVLVALLSLALSAALWWLYFRDDDDVEEAMQKADSAHRARLALTGFGYWHYGLLLGVVAVAAGLKKAIGDPYDPLADSIGIELAVGVGLFTACTVGFRRTLGLGTSRARLVAAALALATIPLGTDASAVLQLAALTAIVVGALLVEARAEVSGQPV
jgi:low temperature requirement protein LtrA